MSEAVLIAVVLATWWITLRIAPRPPRRLSVWALSLIGLGGVLSFTPLVLIFTDVQSPETFREVNAVAAIGGLLSATGVVVTVAAFLRVGLARLLSRR